MPKVVETGPKASRKEGERGWSGEGVVMREKKKKEKEKDFGFCSDFQNSNLYPFWIFLISTSFLRNFDLFFVAIMMLK